MAKDETVLERQTELRKRRSKAEKMYRTFMQTHKESDLKIGAGKGLEPKPWCECHNRNPCPIDKELNE